MVAYGKAYLEEEDYFCFFCKFFVRLLGENWLVLLRSSTFLSELFNEQVGRGIKKQVLLSTLWIIRI